MMLAGWVGGGGEGYGLGGKAPRDGLNGELAPSYETTGLIRLSLCFDSGR